MRSNPALEPEMGVNLGSCENVSGNTQSCGPGRASPPSCQNVILPRRPTSCEEEVLTPQPPPTPPRVFLSQALQAAFALASEYKVEKLCGYVSTNGSKKCVEFLRNEVR